MLIVGAMSVGSVLLDKALIPTADSWVAWLAARTWMPPLREFC